MWITLPGAIEPTVAGRLNVNEDGGTFVYDRSYLGRDDKVELDRSELPLSDVACQA